MNLYKKIKEDIEDRKIAVEYIQRPETPSQTPIPKSVSKKPPSYQTVIKMRKRMIKKRTVDLLASVD